MWGRREPLSQNHVGCNRGIGAGAVGGGVGRWWGVATGARQL
jgi:hypothetical protein